MPPSSFAYSEQIPVPRNGFTVSLAVNTPADSWTDSCWGRHRISWALSVTGVPSDSNVSPADSHGLGGVICPSLLPSSSVARGQGGGQPRAKGVEEVQGRADHPAACPPRGATWPSFLRGHVSEVQGRCMAHAASLATRGSPRQRQRASRPLLWAPRAHSPAGEMVWTGWDMQNAREKGLIPCLWLHLWVSSRSLDWEWISEGTRWRTLLLWISYVGYLGWAREPSPATL